MRRWQNVLQTFMGITLALASSSVFAANLQLLVLLGDRLPAYQSVSDALKRSLPPNVTATVLDAPEDIRNRTDADLILAVGTRAARLAATQPRMPVLVVMMPRSGYEDLLEQIPREFRAPTISAIYLDQPLQRQLAFIRAILPGHRRIGLLYRESDRLDLHMLRETTGAQAFTLIARQATSDRDLFSALDDVLASGDLLLAVADSNIYNGSNIRNVLLSCYRADVPFIGLSQAYVTAGALGAIFSSQEQLTTQTVKAIEDFANRHILPQPQYVHQFTIAVNEQVARSMSILLPPVNQIYAAMTKLEGRSE
jgi:ABC-type uncharacterized transport system substrate-binding protein